MSTLVDPHICPDCRAPLDAAATCTGCGLRLVGPAAAELWQHMQQADRLVEQLRTASAALVPAVPMVATGAVGAAPPSRPLGPPPVSPERRRHLPAISVPVVLLGVGALCLLVAAVVFVTVAWSSLGLAAKTLILLAVTAGFAAAAVALTRRALRWAAETFWLVVAGMLTLDVVAAYGADLVGFGAVDARHVVAAVGAVLVAQAVAVGLWAGRTPLGHVYGLVPVAGIGAVLLAAGEAWTADRSAAATALAVPVLAAAAAGIARVAGGAVRAIGYAVLVSALLSWLALVGQGLDRMSGPIDQHTWWTELTGWPLLVAALLAAVASLLRVPEWARMTGAAAALVTLILFVIGPGAEVTVEVLVLSAITVVLAVVSATAPRVWAFPAAALSALALLGFGVWVLVRPLGTIGDLVTTGPADRANLDLHLSSPDGWPAAWTAVVSAMVVGAAGAGLLRHLTAPAAREAAGRAWIELGPGVLALGATTALLENEPTLVVAVVAWAATTAVAAAMTVTARHHRVALLAGVVFVGYLVVVGLRLAVPSHLLAALLATILALGLAAAYARAGQDLLGGLLRPLLAAASVLLGAFAASHWPYVASGRGDAAGLTVALFAAVVLVGAHAAGRDENSRRCLEGAAGLAGLAAAAYPNDAAVVAMTITILGTALALVATMRADRELFGWAAVAVLGAATLVRVVEDVRAPELYTLPAAALLVGAGVWRLRTDPAVTSVRVLSSGLVLGLVPSLLLALDDPVSARGALVAAAGLAVLGAGVGLRWAAPLLAGAGTTAVLAVRHLGPVVDALPRWISLGTVGVVLLLVGITWESRLRDLRAAGRYLAGLR